MIESGESHAIKSGWGQGRENRVILSLSLLAATRYSNRGGMHREMGSQGLNNMSRDEFSMPGSSILRKGSTVSRVFRAERAVKEHFRANCQGGFGWVLNSLSSETPRGKIQNWGKC